MTSSMIDDYDYDDYDTAYLDEGYLNPIQDNYPWESTFPAGSGAGETTFGAYATDMDEFDLEVEREDEEYLAAETAYLAQNNGAVECYLASSSSAQTFAVGASGMPKRSIRTAHPKFMSSPLATNPGAFIPSVERINWPAR